MASSSAGGDGPSTAGRSSERSLQYCDDDFVPRNVLYIRGNELGGLFDAVENKSVSLASSKSSRLD